MAPATGTWSNGDDLDYRHRRECEPLPGQPSGARRGSRQRCARRNVLRLHALHRSAQARPPCALERGAGAGKGGGPSHHRSRVHERRIFNRTICATSTSSSATSVWSARESKESQRCPLPSPARPASVHRPLDRLPAGLTRTSPAPRRPPTYPSRPRPAPVDKSVANPAGSNGIPSKPKAAGRRGENRYQLNAKLRPLSNTEDRRLRRLDCSSRSLGVLQAGRPGAAHTLPVVAPSSEFDRRLHAASSPERKPT